MNLKELNLYTAYIKKEKNVRVVLHGKSMLPTIKNGDEVLITDDLNDLKLGDIIVYKKKKKMISLNYSR